MHRLRTFTLTAAALVALPAAVHAANSTAIGTGTHTCTLRAGADLRDADLRGANLTGALVSYTNFTAAGFCLTHPAGLVGSPLRVPVPTDNVNFDEMFSLTCAHGTRRHRPCGRGGDRREHSR